MASLPVVEVTEIEKIYGLEAAPEATARYQRLAAAFRNVFGEAPELFARAPGRVNLIGEHIDYEGYSVLPMAIRADTIVAIRVGGDKLHVANVQPDKYSAVELSTDPSQAVDTANHSWANYFLSAYKGVYDFLESKGQTAPEPVGLQVMVDGVVPLGSGLSSSAAFVVSSSLAILAARGISLTKGDVAAFTCKAEQYVGVNSGGMDQAISVMGMPGVAMLVDFNPVRATDVSLPEGATFVIANSLAVSKKAETADKRYNLRVVECRLASALLARSLGASTSDAIEKYQTLQDVEPLIEAKHGPGLAAKQAAVEAALHKGAYLQGEIEGELGEGTRLESVYEGQAAPLRVLRVAAEDGFLLRDRALHVYSEAARVHEFKAVCDGDADTAAKLSELGRLMDASHASCRDLYQCSCEELDSLVGVAKAAGAIGARLTGAGWGGCTVSLVQEEHVPAFLAELRDKYYGPLLASGRATDESMSETLFATRPSAGAAIMRLKLAPPEVEQEPAKEAVAA